MNNILTTQANNIGLKNHRIEKHLELQFVMALISMNILNKYYTVALIYCGLFIIVNLNKVLNISLKNFTLFNLTWFSISYIILYDKFYDINFKKLVVFICPLIFYIVGYLIVNKLNTERILQKYVLIIALGMAFHGLLNTIYGISILGFNFSTRILPDIWLQEDITATGQTTLFVLIAGIVYYSLASVKADKNPTLKFLLILATFDAILYNLLSATRTIFLIFIISFIVCYFIDLSKQKLFFNKSKKIFSLFAFFIIIYTMVSLNLFGIRSIFEESLFGSRILKLQGFFQSTDRLEQVKHVFANFSAYCQGGKPFKLEFIHNTWLSVLNAVGIIPFLFFVMFSLCSIKQSVFAIKHFKKDQMFIIVGIHLAMLILMLIEPLIEANPQLLSNYCFIIGITDRIIQLHFKNNNIMYSQINGG